MKIAVENMTCGHCVRTVTRVLQAIDPQARVDVDLASATVLIEGKVDANQAISALAIEGYPARVHDSGNTPSPATCRGSCHS